ncbi:hypothetical protein BJV74DRAFT_254673 [Russula compacta]|nr:hypothetical protein BJV74DRAFT_254673 [Russula compacta]
MHHPLCSPHTAHRGRDTNNEALTSFFSDIIIVMMLISAPLWGPCLANSIRPRLSAQLAPCKVYLFNLFTRRYIKHICHLHAVPLIYSRSQHSLWRPVPTRHVGASYARVTETYTTTTPNDTNRRIRAFDNDSQVFSWSLPGASSVLIMSPKYPTWSCRLLSRRNLGLASLHILPLECRILG